MDYLNILAGLSSFAEKSFLASGKQLPYHNLDHTRAVVEAAKELCNHFQLDEENRFIVIGAAWFHDMGIIEGPLKNHESRSALMAEAWLMENEIPAGQIEKIKNCILATTKGSHPNNLNEQILTDADMWNIGTDKFTENQKKLRQEIEESEGWKIDTDSWRSKNIELLATHQFHTDYARNLLQPKKEEHLIRLKTKQEKKQKEESSEVEGKKKSKEIDPNIPTKGIETMFRVTINNHLEFSSMADTKANILISVNAIILSIVLSVLLRRLEENPELIIPTCFLLTVNVLTMVFSILAVRPKIIKEKVTPIKENQEQKRVNLLFFGSFTQLPFDYYTIKMKEMMADKDYLYESMISNIYFMGLVLGKKYNYLRIAYNIFMYGFILTILTFIISIML
jgi:predicted metal-dependent HD superfamily phosphohydrolase